MLNVSNNHRFVELIAETTENWQGLRVDVRNLNRKGEFLVDIAIGPCGAEHVVVDHLKVSGDTLTEEFLLFVHKGSRITARVQADPKLLPLGISVKNANEKEK